MADERQQWRDLGRKLANAPMNTTTYALLSQWVYGYLPNSFVALRPESAPPGWEFVAASSSDNGYKAVALRKSGTSQVVIVNAGTDFSESLNGYSSDWIDGNLRGGPGSQIDSAIQFAQSIVGLPNVASVYPTGHSLGGGLAETQVAYLRASGYQHVAGVGYHSAGFGGRIKDFIQSQYGLSVPDIQSYMTHYQSQADINYTLGVGRPTNYLNEGFGLGYLGSTVFVGGEYYRSRYPLSSEYVYFPEGLGTHSNFWKKFEDGTAFTSHIVIDITGRRTKMPGILPAGDITVVSPDKLDLYITELVELERARTTYLGGWNGTISINDAGDLTYTVNGSAPIVVSRFTLPSTRPQYSGLTQSNGVTTYRPAVPDNGDWQDLGVITVVGTRIGNGRYQIVDLLGVRTLVEAFSGVLGMVIDVVEPRRQDAPQGSTVHYENGYRYLVDPDGEFLGGIPQVDAIPDANRSEFLEIAGARIAGRLGSTLGQMLARDNQFVAAFAGQVVGDAASQLAGAFLQGVFRSDVDLSSKVTGAVLDIVNGRSINLGNALGNAAIGTASSYLAAELADALNLDGVVGEVFGVVSTAVLNVAINNVAASLPILSRMDLRPIGWGDAQGLVGSALGSYFGQKLAANVISPNTQAVAIFSSLNAGAAAARGFTVGASIGSAFGPAGTIVGGVIGATVSAFVNAVVATFFGNLFSRKKPKTPSALAEIYLNYVNDRFLLGASSASNGGNIELARLMANTAADTLNGIVKLIGGDVVQTSAIPLQTFGHSGSTLYVKYGGYQRNVQSADEAVEYSVIRSAQQIQIAGGDIYLKRVLKSEVSDIAAWSSDIRVASDYAHYVQNRQSINAVIRDMPNSAFSAAWLVTLQRASELKLSEWSVSDFYGGLRGFLDSMNIEAYGAYMENVRVTDILGGMTLSVKGPTVQDGIFSILPQALNKPLGNDLLNPHFAQSSAGWGMATWNAVAPGYGVNMDANWSGNGNDVLWNRIGASSAPGSVTDIWSEMIESRAGATYEFSVKAAQHRGLARLEVQFLDANDNQVGWVGIPGGGREGGAGQGALANFDTISGTVVAPPGTVKRRMALRIVATGNPIDAYGFFTQPMTREVVNEVANYGWQAGLSGWEMAIWQADGATRGVNLNGVWGSAANPTLYAHIPGTPPAGAIVDNRSEWMAAEAGKTYEASVLAANHRGTAQIFIEFFDANKNYISGHVVGSGGFEGGAAYGDTATYNRIGGRYTAPAGTAYRRIGLRLVANGGDIPFAFFSQPLSGEVGAGVVDWSADGNAIRIDDLTKIGYTKLTDGNTAGRDFLDFSQRTAAVGWSDWSEQTYTNVVWDPRLYEYVEETQTVITTGGDDIVVGSRFGDYLAGAAGWDWIDGGDGDDTIEGGDGNDVLLGGAGRDRLVGGAGDDYLVSGAGDDHPWFGDGFASGMWGGDGNDTIVFNGGVDGGFGENGDDVFLMEQDGFLPGFETSGHYDGNQMDYVDAGAGSDTISYERFTAPFAHNLDVNFWPWANTSVAMPVGGVNGVAVYLGNHPGSWTNGDAYWADAKYIMGDFVKGVENVTGSRFNDYLWGDAGDNVIKGGDGNDFLDGNLGNDILEGGAGADYMVGPGEGTLSYEGSNAGVFIDMTTGEAFGGHATGDRWYQMDHLTGSRFADELKGDAGSNRIKGLAGDDWIVATKGSDVYEGGEGLDTVDYSTGFSSGNATYQVWVEGGYWEYDWWLQQDVWISTGEGHYETQTGYRQGLQVYGGVANWRADEGTGGTHSLIGVEHIIGTAGDDSIAMTETDDYITAGKGNDTLAGGGGGDTYYFNVGDGVDTISENNVGGNVVSFGAEIGFNQLTFSAADGAGGHLTIYYTATDSVRINGNMPTVSQGKLASADDNRIKTIDMNGSGQLDVSQFEIYRGGSAWGDTISGIRTLGDFIAGFGGNDILYGTQPGQWEDHGNIIIGGTGDDTIYTSGGDDQFAFERGSGRDTINDTGGEDVLVFGPNVAADDVIYKVVGNDLYIGIRDAASPNLEAHQVADYVRVVNGGVKWEDVYGGGASFNTVEFINAGGTWIDLRKLDLNWTIQYSYNGGVMPIVFDLNGEGLELTGVESSNVVSRLASGQYSRTSWVGPTNGILAFDRNGDGQINNLAEISFVQDREGAKTDLEGLQAWDTNGDGKLNALDAGWSNLKMWVDRNQNGRSTEQELRTLEQVGITEIDLKGVATGNTAATTRDSFVHNTLSFTWASGEKGTAYDVQLARRLLNELGLSAEQVRAAWGDCSATGELGRLASNPTVAAAARAVLGAPTDPVSARTRFGFDRQDMAVLRDDADWGVGFIADHALDDSEESVDISVDFSDHDGLYADDEARWSDVLNGTVSNGGTINDTDARVRATLEALQQSAGRGAFGQAFGRPEIEAPSAAMVPVGDQSEGQRTFAASSVSNDQIGAAERVDAFSVDGRPSSYGQLFDVDEAAKLLSAVSDADDVWAPAEFSRASIAQGREWWRSAALSPEGLPMLTPFAKLDQASEIEGGSRPAEASQHQQLVQALVAFGPKTGGGNSAIWKRSGEADADAMAGVTSDNRWRFAGPSRIHA